MAVSEYRCEQPDLFTKLSDPMWFAGFVDYQYKRVIFDMEPVWPLLSDYWISQAHFRYNKDIHLVSSKEYDGGKLNHFKHAGFLCYWLRRCPPIYDFTRNADPGLAGIKFRNPKTNLIIYGSALAAFDVGLRVCRFWEAARTDIRYPAAIRDKIRNFNIPAGSPYLDDMCYTLAAKNISPHSLNMVYGSLFDGFRQ